MNKKMENSVISIITIGCICFGQITFDDVSSEKHIDDPGNASGVAFVDYDQV